MRILVVEDKLPLNNSLTRLLRAKKYAADQAFDGQEALDVADSALHDLVILDLSLPRVDGLEVLARLRERGDKMPILVLTARGTIPQIVDGLRRGADDYLPKPFDIEELLARVQALLRRSLGRPHSCLQVDDLVLDPDSGDVTRGQTSIKLSRTEYQLLYYLMSKAHWIVTKSELLAHVWENDTDVYDRVVDTYICFLRRKIDKPFPGRPALIQTVKTRGYRVGGALGRGESDV